MIIGLIGAPSVGKDDVAAYILIHRYGFSRFAFADGVKKRYFIESGITEEYFKSCRGTEEEERIRKELWAYGDKYKKELGEYHFINPVINEVIKHKDAVITDIRTIAELEKVMEIADLIILITKDKDFMLKNHNEMLPGTRIPLYKLSQCKVFLNNIEDLKEARERFKEECLSFMEEK